jgi:hypothetical protein
MLDDRSSRRPRRLGEIARGGNVDALRAGWASARAVASDPIPSGTYRVLVADGRLFNSQAQGTPGYKLDLQVLNGPYAGRRLWYDLWLTADALPRSKWELTILGITELDQLDLPLPAGLIADAVVALRTGDDGIQFNRVRRLSAVPGAAPVDDFAPPPATCDASAPTPDGAAGG